MSKRVVRGSSATSPIASSPALNVDSDDDDEEDAFMRNKTTDNKLRWAAMSKRNQTAKKIDVTEISSDSDSSAGNGESDGTPKPRKKKSKAKPKPVVPVWTKRPPTARLTTTSDEDDIVVLKDSNGAREGGRGIQRSRKRTRSRSRSSGELTPPPELTAEEKARAKAVVESALSLPPPSKKQRTPPIDVDDLDFDFSSAGLNPELARIAKRVLAAPAKRPAVAAQKSHGQSVVAHVQWLAHPVDDPDAPLQEWAFAIGRGDTFASGLLPKLVEATRAQELVLRYEGKRVFRTSTPESLNIWGEADFQVCTPATWEYVSTHHDEPTEAHRSVSPVDRAVSEAPTEPSADEGDESFTLILRAKDHKDVSLKVKPTATAAKVVAAYLKRVPGGAKKKGVHLVFEGETVAPTATLASLDLEDEDVLDVRGL